MPRQRSSPLSRHFKRQLDDYTVADQVICLARIVETKILSINRELRVYRNIVGRYLNRRGKADRLLYAMQVEITGDHMSGAVGCVWFNSGRNKGSSGLFRNIEKVRRL